MRIAGDESEQGKMKQDRSSKVKRETLVSSEDNFGISRSQLPTRRLRSRTMAGS